MEKATKRSLLLDKGIILQSGTICRDKINLISGAMTAPLIETIWTFSGYDTEAMERVSAIFTNLYYEGREAEMMAVLRILYDLSGLQFPEDVELLATHPEARQYFLISFLLDMEDCMQGLMAEAVGE
jgi:hypothetical protein